MSRRDLKNLGDLGGDPPHGLRNGCQREGIQLSSTPRPSEPFEDRPCPEFSRIHPPQPLVDPNTGAHFWQSPMGNGYSTALVREARRSTDYYMEKHNVESEFEKLSEKLNNTDWTCTMKQIGLV